MTDTPPRSWTARVGQGLQRGYDWLQAWRHRGPPAMELARYDATLSVDFLVHWWWRLRESEELAQFGAEAGSVSRFVCVFVLLGPGRMVVLHAPGAAWEEARGLLAVGWFAETAPQERACLGWWIAPPFDRQMDSVWPPIAERLVNYGFGELGLQAFDVPFVGRPLVMTRQCWEEHRCPEKRKP